MTQRTYPKWAYWLADRAARALIWVLLRVPYRLRIAAMGRLLTGLGHLTGHHRRAVAQLGFIFPDMAAARRRKLASGALDNAGRSFIENYSTADQLARAQNWDPEGPGWPICEAARQAGQPIIFVSAHFGNYQAARAAMNLRGYNISGLYRPMNNPYFNDHYVASIEAVGGRAYPRGRRGLAGFLRVLQDGGNVAILLDQYVHDGARLDFLGKTAPTSLSAAEIALKFNAPLVPVYGERLEDGENIRVFIDTPVPPSDARTMTQALNDSLAARVRLFPDQWFWLHRRWKPARQAEADRIAATPDSGAEDDAP